MSLPDVFDLYIHRSCHWTPVFLCTAPFVLSASGACQWTPVFLRFVEMYLDAIQWGFMQQQSRHYCHTFLYCLTLNDEIPKEVTRTAQKRKVAS
jgi:hypothetical protein